MHIVPDFYGVYVLQSVPKPRLFYIGSTPDPERRLKQHNGDLKAGAYRTRKLGSRPWKMVLVVSGFPSKISALQFEHALQHTYKSRHIRHAKISNNKSPFPSLHIGLAHVRSLVTSTYFGALNLQVNILDENALKVWDLNKYDISFDGVKYWDFDLFIHTIKHGFFSVPQYHTLKALLMNVQKCRGCGEDIDMMPDSQPVGLATITTCCENIYHLRCVTSDLVPKFVGCKICGETMEWFKLAMMATRLRKEFSS